MKQNKRKVITIVGTRPELIKLCRIIHELDLYTDHVLVHTGQNYDYELNELFFKDLEIRKPDYFLNVAGNTASETIANVISKSDEILAKENPEALLLYGDTNSCLSVISAKKRKIPVFHMEAGNRCFDQRVPEEINRKIIDHLSDINIPLTEHARRYLIAEGIKQETIIKSGSTLKEILSYYKNKIDRSSILENLKIKAKDYFLVSTHREENLDNPVNFTNLIESLKIIGDTYKKPIIVSTHPRTRKKLDSLGYSNIEGIIFSKPLGFFDYIKLQQNAYCVISDSGTITEESSILNFPAVTIRQAHERPEGMDAGVLIMTDLKSDKIINAIIIVTQQYSIPRLVDDYEMENVSQKIVKIIISYIDYINRTMWFKGI